MGAEFNHEERAGFNVFAMPCNTLTCRHYTKLLTGSCKSRNL